MAPADAAPNATKMSRAVTLTALSLGFVVVQLDVTIVNVALTHIGATFGSGVSELQWVVNAYTLTFAALILTAGALGDRSGAKRVFIVGFAVFVLASLACALAPTFATLVAARTIQGVGAAILVPCSLALLNHTYSGDAARARAVAVWAAGASAALSAGPVVGGVLIAVFSWRSIFLINVPLGLIGIGLTWRYARETPRSAQTGVDLGGQLAGIIALGALAAATIEGGARGWTDPPVLTGFTVCVLAGVAFVAIEARVTRPMLPLSLFTRRTFSATALIGLCVNVAFYGLIFVFSLLFQQVKGYTALQTGLAFVPMTAAIMAANVIAGRLSSRIGPRTVIMSGAALLALACLGLLGVGATTPYPAMAVQLLAMGAGLGLVVPPLTSSLLGSVERARSGVASGVLNTTRQAGSVLGVSLFGSLVGRHHHFVPGLHVALILSGVLVFIGCGLALFIHTEDVS